MSQFNIRDNKFTLGHALYPYIERDINITYSSNTNRKAVTLSGDSVSFISTAKPVSYKIVKFNFSRMNAAPDLPAMQDFYKDNVDDVIISCDVQTANPITGQDGTTIYQIAGMIVYGCRTVQDPTRIPLAMPKGPDDGNHVQWASVGANNNNTNSWEGFFYAATPVVQNIFEQNMFQTLGTKNSATNDPKKPTDITG